MSNATLPPISTYVKWFGDFEPDIRFILLIWRPFWQNICLHLFNSFLFSVMLWATHAYPVPSLHNLQCWRVLKGCSNHVLVLGQAPHNFHNFTPPRVCLPPAKMLHGFNMTWAGAWLAARRHLVTQSVPQTTQQGLTLSARIVERE